MSLQNYFSLMDVSGPVICSTGRKSQGSPFLLQGLKVFEVTQLCVLIYVCQNSELCTNSVSLTVGNYSSIKVTLKSKTQKLSNKVIQNT